MSVASRRERERQRRRDSILEAAARVFFSRGFLVATMDDVAAEAELSKGTLYLYFKNKDDLFLELSGRVLGAIVKTFEALAVGDGPGLTILGEMLSAYASHVERNPEHFRIAAGWVVSSEQVDTETESFGRHRALIARLLSALVSVIERGRSDGSIRPELDPTQTAAQLWASLFGLLQIHINRCELERRLPHKIDSDRFVSGFVELLTAGLRNPEATTAESP